MFGCELCPMFGCELCPMFGCEPCPIFKCEPCSLAVKRDSVAIEVICIHQHACPRTIFLVSAPAMTQQTSCTTAFVCLFVCSLQARQTRKHRQLQCMHVEATDLWRIWGRLTRMIPVWLPWAHESSRTQKSMNRLPTTNNQQLPTLILPIIKKLEVTTKNQHDMSDIPGVTRQNAKP
jgi:hypothetical protein